MSFVPGPYDIHGWHPFKAGWQGEAWCGFCDCLDIEHVSLTEYEARKTDFEEQAERYRQIREMEEN